MPATLRRASRLPGEPPGSHTPRLPTVVVASYKGGTGKTAVAVAAAERLAWAGLRVLLISCDSHEGARYRLGIREHDAHIAHRTYGERGLITVVGMRSTKAVEMLYRSGPEQLGAGTFDLAMVDTPPEVMGGSLPGVLLIATLDGTDEARNLVMMLRRTPANTDIVLVWLGWADPNEWAHNAEVIHQAIGRDIDYIETPLPRSQSIKDAHDEGRSVWTLRRTGRTLAFLNGVDALAHLGWCRIYPNQPWPAMVPAAASAAYVPGWDDDE